MSNDIDHAMAPHIEPPVTPNHSPKARNRTLLIAGVVALLVAGSVFAGTDPSTTTDSKARPATATPVVAVPETTIPQRSPQPSATQMTALAAALVAIDPRMSDADRYLQRSLDQCEDLRRPEITDGATLVASARERFGDDSLPDLSGAQLQQILDAVVTTFCH